MSTEKTGTMVKPPSGRFKQLADGIINSSAITPKRSAMVARFGLIRATCRLFGPDLYRRRFSTTGAGEQVEAGCAPTRKSGAA